MKTVTELLAAMDAELEAQDAEERDNFFSDVAELRRFITEETPGASVSICVRLCVLALERTSNNKGTCLTCVSAYAVERLKALKLRLARMDEPRKKNFIFRLTIWDAKNRAPGTRDRLRAGSVYEFRQIHSVGFFKDTAQGSMQMTDKGEDRIKEVTSYSPTNFHEEVKTGQS